MSNRRVADASRDGDDNLTARVFHACTVLRESADPVEASQWAATPRTTVWTDEASVVFSG
jgi:hypothetical protein